MDEKVKYSHTFLRLYKLLKGDLGGALVAWEKLGQNIDHNVDEHVVIWYITGYLIAKGDV